MAPLRNPLAAALLALFLGAGPVRGQEGESCVDCHLDLADSLSGLHDHAPFENGNCEACHRHHGFQPKMELDGTVFDVCAQCHLETVDLPEDALHYPLTEEESCLYCHVPHSAETDDFLSAPASELCLDCHDGPDGEARGVHAPFAEKDCLACHDPHGSIFPHFLKLPPAYVCIDCHGDILGDASLEELHAFDDGSLCERCHGGHAITKSGQVGADLCARCHDLEDAELLDRHLGLTPSRCTECHDPHGPQSASLIREFQHGPFADGDCDTCHDPDLDVTERRADTLCLDCHDTPGAEGAHAPATVRGRACVDCHTPHASDDRALLRR